VLDKTVAPSVGRQPKSEARGNDPNPATALRTTTEHILNANARLGRFPYPNVFCKGAAILCLYQDS
jgi:hypothetical protein